MTVRPIVAAVEFGQAVCGGGVSGVLHFATNLRLASLVLSRQGHNRRDDIDAGYESECDLKCRSKVLPISAI